jgi:PAS domain S-box-containing protein
MTNIPNIPQSESLNNGPPRLLKEKQRQNDLLDALCEANPSGVAVLVGPELHFAYVNPVYRYLTPDPKIDPLGKSYDQVWPEKTRYAHRDHFRQVLECGQPFQAEGIEHIFLDGGRRIFTVQARRMNWDQQPACLLILWDTTEQKIAEERLAYHTELLENVHDAIIATDVQMNITAWNPAAEQLYGWSESEALGQNMAQLVRSELVGKAREQVMDELLNSGFFQGELIHYSRDGRRLVIEGRTKIQKDACGKVIGLITSNRDITERTQNEERLVDFLESTHDSFFALDRDWNFVYVNQRYGKIVDLDPQEMVGKNFWELFPNYVGTPIEQIYRKGMVEGQPIHFQSLGMYSDRWYDISINTNRDGISVFAADRTEKIQAAERLRESEERFRVLADNNPSFIWVTDAQGGNQFVNRTYREYFGVTTEQVEGGTWQPFLHPEDGPAYVTEFMQATHEHTPFNAEVRVKRKDGEWRWMSTQAEPLFSASGVYLGHVGNSSDITERLNSGEETRARTSKIELQQRLLEQREQERQQIARDLHDGPVQALTVATYAISGALMDGCSPVVAQQLEAIQTSLQEQISELRAYAGELRPPTLSKFGLGKAILSHSDTFQEKHPELHVTFDNQQEGGLLPEEKRLALYRIYQESLVNILKHAKATQVMIHLLKDQNEVVLEIRDNGKGFEAPKDWLELARHAHLGLVGMRERAEAIGGHLEVHSHSGQGTQIQIHVPLQEPGEIAQL